MSEFAAGPLTRGLWQQARPTIGQIEVLPFLRELVAGDLDALAFAFYILQDDLYLAGYARAMALLAARAPEAAQARFWAESVTGAIAAEEDMHRALLADSSLIRAHDTLRGSVRASPTTLGYVSFLEASAALRPHGIGVAAILPCFWVYAHVGKLLTRQRSSIADDHPYRTWIALYFWRPLRARSIDSRPLSTRAGAGSILESPVDCRSGWRPLRRRGTS